MNKFYKIYIALFVLVIGFLTFLELTKTPVINWSPNYDVFQKSPYGLYVFEQEADHFFNDRLERIYTSPYDYFTADSLNKTPRNYFYVEYNTDQVSIDKLLEKVNQGDNLFITSSGIGLYYLTDKLRLNTNYLSHDSIELELLNSNQPNHKIKIDRYDTYSYFSTIDSTNTKILGTINNYHDDVYPNFIRIKRGKGYVFLNTAPVFLTNYYLLSDDDYQYAEKAFSYLPDRETIWFQPEKNYKSSSPFRFILTKPALRNAFLLMLFGLLLFVIFYAKRRQRIVPVIPPVENKSAQFIQTISNLYLNEGNYKDMANKKAVYFLNRVRSELLIDTTNLNETFVKRLSIKTNTPEDEIQKVIPLLEKALHPKTSYLKEELIQLNDSLNKIYL